jgi:hypothetical protein
VEFADEPDALAGATKVGFVFEATATGALLRFPAPGNTKMASSLPDLGLWLAEGFTVEEAEVFA